VGVILARVPGMEVQQENTETTAILRLQVDDWWKVEFDLASADKAYSSRDNHTIVRSIGDTPFIAFRSNAAGNSSGSYTRVRMFRYFTYNREEFLTHYHNRSNVESTIWMIKSKFTDLVRSKDRTAQLNEVLLKVLCHNIYVLIQESFELGIDAKFIN
jgi:transposase